MTGNRREPTSNLDAEHRKYITRLTDIPAVTNDIVPVLATAAAAILVIAAFVTLFFMQRPVLSGTFFTFTAFAIYLREKTST